MTRKSLSTNKEKAGQSSNEFEDFGQSAKLGSDFSLVVIMLALILFCVSAWLGFNHLTKVIGRRTVTPSIPVQHPATHPLSHPSGEI